MKDSQIYLNVLTRKDIKILVFCIVSGTVTGAILQIVCKRYLKNHPELLEELPESKKPPVNLPRGGVVLTEIAAIKVFGIKVASFLASKRLITGLSGGVLGFFGH